MCHLNQTHLPDFKLEHIDYGQCYLTTYQLLLLSLVVFDVTSRYKVAP